MLVREHIRHSTRRLLQAHHTPKLDLRVSFKAKIRQSVHHNTVTNNNSLRPCHNCPRISKYKSVFLSRDQLLCSRNP